MGGVSIAMFDYERVPILSAFYDHFIETMIKVVQFGVAYAQTTSYVFCFQGIVRNFDWKNIFVS